MSWFDAARARLRLLSRRAAESRIDDEIRFHIDMETERLVRQEHLTPDAARRRALVTFGGAQQHRETLREGRGIAWLSGLSLDLKLGFRMLVKYPGLTIVGGLAMAFGIWFGAVTFEMGGILISPTLPFRGGDRIVQIRNWDLKENGADQRALYDFVNWRRTVRSVTDLGAYRNVEANLVGPDGNAHPAVAAEVTASAFRMVPGSPLLGRALDASDERPNAPPVVVIGHDIWRTRFASDTRVLGRSVQIGNTYATIVGVMPEGFAFPVSHELWMPFRVDALVPEPRSGLPITVFGRLASGVSLEEAQAELTTLGERAAAQHPVTHTQLKPRVTPYALAYSEPSAEERLMMLLIDFFAVMLLAVVCSNVALLLFARAASREGEILVRSALGASRRRIVVQLFAEALALGAVAAVIGLSAAHLSLTLWGEPFLEHNLGRLPFWWDVSISPTTVVYACALAVLGAVIAGVIPARKITSGLGSRLKEGTAGGGGPSFGGIWTAVIVMQVALTVAFPAVVRLEHNEINRIRSFDVGFADEEYLGMTLELERPPVDATGPAAEAMWRERAARFTALVQTLRRRVEAEPGVTGVTFVDHLPRDYHREDFIDIATLPGNELHEVSMAFIDANYFDVLNAPLRSGRPFTTAEVETHAKVLIVDEGFVDLVMQGRNPIGHRVWLSADRKDDPDAADRQLFEIVGVAKDLGMTHAVASQRPAGMYFPVLPGNAEPLAMIVHTRGDPLAIGGRIRAIATQVDPTLRIPTMQRMDEVANPVLWVAGLWLRITIGLTGMALLLSLAGIYAVLSYTVARRTREIGVRVALGASARRVITSIFRRPLWQVTGGVAAGGVLIAGAASLLARSTQFSGTGMELTLADGALLVAYAVVMLGVCLLACIVPTWRALRVQPTEALRAE